MKAVKNKNIKMLVLTILALLLVCPTAFSVEMPKPGTVINKGNIDQYTECFPDFWIDAFKTGYGIIAPLSITIEETKANKSPREFLQASEANKGKYSIDADGYIAGGPYEEIVGFPFPDVTPDDPDFATKLMWNYEYKYQFDDVHTTFWNYEKRLGSPVSTALVETHQIYFSGRMYVDPKPVYETAQNYRFANRIRNLSPPVQRNFITLLIRYIDQKALDATYLYLPSMRRVLRGEAGERSTPIMSSTQAPDDFDGGFQGRKAEFTYKFVADKKVIGQGSTTYSYETMGEKDLPDPNFLPMDPEGWQVRDVWVIDVFSKSAKYPQSRKQLWIDKDNMNCLYSAAWDRAGKIWKIWQTGHTKYPNTAASGQMVPYYPGMIGMDIQLGYGTQMIGTWKINEGAISAEDISISAIRKLGR